MCNDKKLKEILRHIEPKTDYILEWSEKQQDEQRCKRGQAWLFGIEAKSASSPVPQLRDDSTMI